MNNRKGILLILSMIIIIMTACSNNAADDIPKNDTAQISEETTAAEETTASRLDDLGTNDFEGREFRVLDANDHPDRHINMPADEQTGDIINDALYTRDALMEEKYNLDIKYTQISMAVDACKVLSSSVQAGDAAYDMVIGPLPGNALGASAVNGVLMNLIDVPYISLEENWWSPLVYNSLRLNNKLYYSASDISPSIYQGSAALYLNKRIYNDYNMTTDYYGLVYDGKWTLNVLEEITKDMRIDIDNDGVYKTTTDFFGFIYELNTLSTDSFMIGAGIDLIHVNKEGKIEIDLMNEKVLDTVTTLTRIMEPYINDSDLYGLNKVSFKSGLSFIMQHYTETALVHLRDMEDDYAILPNPKYDERQDTYRSMLNSWVDAFIAVPLTGDPEFSGFVMEALAYYSYENIRPLVYTITFQDKLTRDEDSVNMLEIIFNTTCLDFSDIYAFGGIPNILHNTIVNDKSFASEYAAVEEKMWTEVDKFIESWG